MDIKNIGLGTAELAANNVKHLLNVTKGSSSTGAPIIATGIQYLSAPDNTLAPGQITSILAPYTFSSVAGEYCLFERQGAQTDYHRTIKETNENNNDYPSNVCITVS